MNIPDYHCRAFVKVEGVSEVCYASCILLGLAFLILKLDAINISDTSSI